MGRLPILAVAITTLAITAVAAWADHRDQAAARAVWVPASVVPTTAAAWRPPVVLVDRGVDVDQDQAQAFMAQLARDPRGWRRDLDQYVIRIVRTGTQGTQPMPGLIGHALTDQGVAIISEQAWTTLGPSLATAGGTLDDQRAWIVLHELGHLISRTGGHEECGGPGRSAPAMRSTSYGIGPCSFNVWPNPHHGAFPPR